ncbi:hypothetical protein D3C85_919970 [compost metagenome]
MQPVALVALPMPVELRLLPFAIALGGQQVGQHGAALQLFDRAAEHLGHGRIGKTDQAIFADHHDPLGGVIQYRGVESPRAIQLPGQLQ